MTTVDLQPHFRRRGTDHLGFLSTKLGDLLGFATLAYELIQNADDALATSMGFDVRDEALVVDNNGQFSQCDALDESEDCPWKSDRVRNRMCDFHRFQIVASGDKQNESDATGAFGIGFTAVYQITDQPELISRGRHWIIREDRPEQERIEECPGCNICSGNNLPGTRFILPWATDPTSSLRQKLRVDAVSQDGPEQMVEELERSLPLAMLFLKNLESVTIRRNGQSRKTLERIVDETSVIIADGSRETLWHVFRGDFSEAAAELRQRYPAKIENARPTEVAIAVPASPIDEGLLCVVLPTQHRTGLPFHINAHFFPKSDRKGIHLESDWQSHWNRTAIQAAAAAFAAGLDRLRQSVGHKRFWEILNSVRRVADDADKGRRDKSLRSFWSQAEMALRRLPVIFTTHTQWATPEEVVFLEREDEAKAVHILEALGFKVVHSDLRFAHDLLRSEAVGVGLLTAARLAECLQHAGVVGRKERRELPQCLQDDQAIGCLWEELICLLAQLQRPNCPVHLRQRVREEVAKCAIAPCCDGAYWPCRQAFRGDAHTATLFQPLLCDGSFLAVSDQRFEPLSDLCPVFDAAAAINILGKIDADKLAMTLRMASSAPHNCSAGLKIAAKKSLALASCEGRWPRCPSTRVRLGRAR